MFFLIGEYWCIFFLEGCGVALDSLLVSLLLRGLK